MHSRTNRRCRRDPAFVATLVPLALTLVLASLLSWPNSALAVEAYQYLSPVPSSALVSRWNNVAIRYGDPIDPTTVDPALLSVVGSESGAHGGDFTLSDDLRTLVFTPDRPYALGETVVVTLARGTRTSDRAVLPPLTFSFSVARTDPALRPIQSYDEFDLHPSGGSTTAMTLPDAPGIQDRASAGSLPPDYPQILFNFSDHPDPGYVFMGPRTDLIPAPLLIIDNHLMPIFYRRAPYEQFDFKMQPNGRLTYFDNSRRKFYALDSTYAIVDSFAARNGYIADPHDMQLLSNGHALLVIYDTQPVRMDLIVPGGDPDAFVAGLIIQEIDASKNVVFQWRSWDHFNITDAVNVDLTASFVDYVHCNAVERDTDGNLLISSRHLNEITKINRQTGAVIWRFGPNAKNNEFATYNDPRGFAYQHDIRRLPNGHITLFDNGNFLDPQTSRVVEYRLDEIAKTAWLVWDEWPSTPGWANSNGNVQRRPNGSTMIGWGAGTIYWNVTDLHADGTKALELRANGTTYRAFRHPWETRRFVTDTKLLHFNGLDVGDRDTLALSITSRVSGIVRITSFVSLDSAVLWVPNPTPITIPSHGTITVNVVFQPDTLGAFHSTLYVRSETTTEIIAQDVEVEGEGVTGVFEVSVRSPNGGEIFAAGGDLDLTWNAAQGVGVTTVDLLLSRTGPDGPFEAIALGVPNTGAYAWPLDGPATTEAYLKVVAHDERGNTGLDLSDAAFTILPVNTGVGDAPIAGFMLAPVAPNPTYDRARIGYTVAHTVPVRLSVFDLNGRVIAVLFDGVRAPGRYHASWDGVRGGERAAPGVYLVRFEAAGMSFARRIVLLR